MMQPDRTVKPQAHPIGEINLIEPEHYLLANNLPVYELSAGTQEVVKIELLFNAGTAHHANPLIPAFTIGMMEEGTRNHTAAEIAASIDDYGAFLESDHDQDFAGINLFTLNRFLGNTLPVIREIITEPIFPEKEWEIMRSNRLDKYRINQGKVGFIAGKYFQELIFSGSPYRTHFDEQSYLNASRNEISDFWNEHYPLAGAILFVSGKIDDGVRKNIADTFGSTVPLQHHFNRELKPVSPSDITSRENFISKPDAIQSAIRIGRRLFPKNHPDYFGMKVLATILGGYFGSRLMANIREDKGYTYGIGAGVASYRNDGYFVISTEVGADVTEKALNEIYHEIELLQSKLVPEDELNLVKNYMLGNLLKSFDGPIEQMERFKSVVLHGLDLRFYTHYAEAIRQISSERLLSLAKIWLQKDDLIELVVGRK